MATEMRSDRTQYSLIITRRKASEILLSAQHLRWSLPQVEVPDGVRVTGQLLSRIKREYHLDTYCFWSKSMPPSPEVCCRNKYAVLEALHQNDETHPATMWISSARAASETAFAPVDRAAISSSLEDLDRYIAEPGKGPFAKPGWIQELFCWVRDQIEPFGLHTTGKFEQLNASATFSLVRIETTGGAVWFKATGEPNVQELPISVALHRLFPNYVPRILGVHPSWNGWLSEEVQGQKPDAADARAWAEVAKALAELQIASASHTDTLVESGCKDMRAEQLAGQIDPFLVRVNELMAVQTSNPPQILTESELQFLGDCLRGAFYETQRNRIPWTLAHLDFNPGNIVVSPTRCCFLDWAEGCVAHPFLTFEYLREHARRLLPRPLTEKLVAAYLGPWQSLFSAESLALAMSNSPLLAVFACAVNVNLRWPHVLCNPASAGYLRSLARRAYREATKLATRSNRCLA